MYVLKNVLVQDHPKTGELHFRGDKKRESRVPLKGKQIKAARIEFVAKPLKRKLDK